MAVKEFAIFIKRQAGSKAPGLFAGAVAVGLLQAVILLVLMNGVEDYSRNDRISAHSYLCFLAAVGAYFLAYRHSVGLGLSVALNFIASSQESITRRLLDLKYGEFDRLRQTEIYAALSVNTGLITEGARFLPNCLAACVLLACALAYSLTISLAGSVSLIVMFAAVVIAFQVLEHGARIWREKAMLAGQAFMTGVEGIFGGFVELKLNQKRKQEFFEHRLLKPCAEAAGQQREYELIHMRGNCLYAVLNYLPAGIIAFVIPFYLDIDTADLLKFIGVALFATPALVNLAMFEPLTAKALETVRALEDLEHSLGLKGERVCLEAPQKAPSFHERLMVEGLKYAYPLVGPGRVAADERERFRLRVDKFELAKGELVIIHGGNGNGKSTFFQLLAGLREADEGRVTIDGEDLKTAGLNNYRALFSTVFTNFYLFDSLFGLDVSPQQVAEALRQVSLGPDVVRLLPDGSFSSLSLSSGQRKRLALACAFLENRPIFLLDEVAADFDPGFRKKFYTEILPGLKSPERAIVAVSHDDRFFGVADRILKMEKNPETHWSELTDDTARWRSGQ